MTCTICEQLQDKTQILYEDEHSVALAGDAILGHIKIYPKKHVHNIEELEDEEVSHLFTVANSAASVVFETLAAQGTNLIANASGHDEHLCIDVVPRTMNDDLNLQWQPQSLEEEEMNDAFERIKDKADYMGVERKEKKKTQEATAAQDDKPQEKNVQEKEDKYARLRKHLERSP